MISDTDKFLANLVFENSKYNIDKDNFWYLIAILGSANIRTTLIGLNTNIINNNSIEELFKQSKYCFYIDDKHIILSCSKNELIESKFGELNKVSMYDCLLDFNIEFLQEVHEKGYAFIKTLNSKILTAKKQQIIDNLQEKIICSAIWYNSESKYEHQPFNIESGFVVTGLRHHNCLTTVSIISTSKYFKDATFCNPYTEKKIQGFLTNKNRFVDRSEGWNIAKVANQIIERKGQIQGTLFSEDLY